MTQRDSGSSLRMSYHTFVFFRGTQRECQCVQTFGELVFKQGMNLARAGNAGLSDERFGDDQHRIMRLAARGGAGVAGVLGAVVLHEEEAGGEGVAQGRFDPGRAAGGVCVHAARMGAGAGRPQALCRISLFPKSGFGST